MVRRAALGLALLFALIAARGADLPARTFRIDPQPLASALRLFAEQAQVQLIFSEQDVSGLTSDAVTGDLPPRAALGALLRGTALEFELTPNNVAVVRKARQLAGAPATSRRGTGREQSTAPRDSHGDDAEHVPLQAVTITGSRIVRRDLEAASPIVTVDAQAFEQSSTLAVESVLNQLPQFVPASTQFVTNDVFPTATNTPGIATLNLRGLATNRTLVLIDGRRVQPANSTLVIDVNSIPAAAISRVEIITGGASATYGADALSGVVNFKLRDNFEGATLEAHSGITEVGDGAERRLSALLGSNLDDGRGNVMLGLEWTRRSAASFLGRRFFENGWTDPGAPATSVRIDYSAYEPNASAGGLPSQAAANALFPERPAGTNVDRATAFYVNRDSTLFKSAGALGYTGELGRKFKVQPNGVLGENNLDELASSPLTRYAFLGRGHYALTDHAQVFAQAIFSNTRVQSLAQPAGATGTFAASIPRNAEHPIPDELAALLDSRGPDVLSTTQFDPTTGKPIVVTGANANWRLGRTLDFLPPRQLRNTSDVYQILVGFQGELPRTDWTWELYATHGDSRTSNDYIGFASLQRYRAVVQAPFYGRGFTQTGAGQTQLSCTSGLPIFEPIEVSQDCIDAITIDASDRTRLSQNIVEANVQGRVAELPAGELRAAAGATYRKNRFEFRPDAIRASNSIIDIPIGTFSNAQVKGSTAVSELYAEALVPLLRERPFVDSLSAELGARYSRYDTAGNVPTYKALLSWAPLGSVHFRGGFQLANRAPNVNELFLSASSVPVTLRGPDPCRADTRDANGNRPDNPHRAEVQALCSAIIGTGTSTFDENPDTFIGDGRADGGEIELRSGNPDVKSEKGRTWTFGVVFQSPFEHPLARQLTLAVDWYRAKVTGAIAQVGAQTTYDLCFNRDGVSNPTYSLDDPNGMCRRIARDAVTGDREYVESTYANLGTLQTSGIDLEASWAVRPAELGFEHVPGTLSLDILLNKLLSFESQAFPTSAVVENEGTFIRDGSQSRGIFAYRAFTRLGYTHGAADVALTWRRLPSIRSANYVADPNTPFAGADSYSVFNLAADWRASEVMQLTAGIDNLFDRDPNRVGAGPGNNGAGNTEPAIYDVLGRRYYLGVRLDF